MPAGRPSKYTPELLQKCREYINNYESYTDSIEVIPSHIGLALFIGISTTCLYDWQKEEGKEEFSDILDEILALQHQVLINKGLTNQFNSNIVKLALGKHGYSDKVDTTHGGSIKHDRDITDLELAHEIIAILTGGQKGQTDQDSEASKTIMEAIARATGTSSKDGS